MTSVNAGRIRWYQIDDDDYATERAMKETLRVGGFEVLNVYVQRLDDSYYGYATLPSPNPSSLVWDGVNINNTAIIGGVVGAGNTLVHEGKEVIVLFL